MLGLNNIYKSGKAYWSNHVNEWSNLKILQDCMVMKSSKCVCKQSHGTSPHKDLSTKTVWEEE